MVPIMTSLRSIGAILGILLFAGCSQPPVSETIPKADVTIGWAQIPRSAEWGQVTAVDVDSHGHVFVLQRGDRAWVEPFPSAPIAYPTVYMFAPDGALLKRWGAGGLVMPHGLSIGEGDAVWITDAQREQVLRFSHDGAPEAAWGVRGESGDAPDRFGRPADVAPTPDAVYVADGYVHSRIASFAPDGRFLSQWGVPGDGEDGFALPHGIAVAGDRIYVADRENSRIKVFASDGALEAIWRLPGHPYAVKPFPGGGIATLEGRDAQDRSIAVLRLWNEDGTQLGAYDVAAPTGTTKGHDFAVAGDGTVFVADVEGGRLLTAKLLTGRLPQPKGR